MKTCTNLLDTPTVKEVFSTGVITRKYGNPVFLWKTGITPSEY